MGIDDLFWKINYFWLIYKYLENSNIHVGLMLGAMFTKIKSYQTNLDSILYLWYSVERKLKGSPSKYSILIASKFLEKCFMLSLWICARINSSE